MFSYLKSVVIIVAITLLALLFLLISKFGPSPGHCRTGNCVNGYGQANYRDGRVYEGNFLKEKRSGSGVMKYPNGDTIEGRWKQGKLHGEAKQTYASGHIFEGTFVDGEKEGQGRMLFVGGLRLEGNWKNGGPDGAMKLIDTTGHEAIGTYKNGKVLQGTGIYVYEDGSFYIGEWGESKRHGVGILYSPTGEEVYAGSWENDSPIERLDP